MNRVSLAFMIVENNGFMQKAFSDSGDYTQCLKMILKKKNCFFFIVLEAVQKTFRN